MQQGGLRRLDPNTARRGHSIWAGIDRDELENQAQALHVKQHVAGRRNYAAAVASEDDGRYPLSIDLEQSLADDLAFIAACQPNANFVTAVALEQCTGEAAFVVKVASNEGVTGQVKDTLNEIFTILRRHASKDITRDSCQRQLFHTIVLLNHNKILGRLGSFRFKKPKNKKMIRSRGPLPARLRKLFYSSLGHRIAGRPPSADLTSLEYQLSAFEEAFVRLEDGDDTDVVVNTEAVVQQAFVLTHDELRLPARLQALGFPASLLEEKDLRDLGKVSNYWRISRHLAVCSSRFRSSFAKLELQCLPPYSASPTSNVVRRQYVHAEIQLLVHYELAPLQLGPRTIGVSKEACFLCDAFIRAHGRFSFTGAHRQMFPRWAIPDLKEYAPHSVEHFRTVLSHVAAEVEAEYRRAQEKISKAPPPYQSAVNINAVYLASPASTLSIRARSASGSSVPTVMSNGTLTQSVKNGTPLTAGSRSDLTGPQLHDELSRIPSEDQKHRKPADLQEFATGDVPLEITVDPSLAGLADCFHLFASISGPPSSPSLTRRFIGGSVSLEPALIPEHGRTFRLADIKPREELVLNEDSQDDPNELSFHLIGLSGQRIHVRCRWHYPQGYDSH